MNTLQEIEDHMKHKGEAQDNFIRYVRTKALFDERFRNVRLRRSAPDGYTHIPTKEIEARFFVYPEFDRKTELRELIDSGQLAATIKKIEGRNTYFYKALEPGPLALPLLKVQNTDHYKPIHFKMREILGQVSLKAGSPSTEYFNTFLHNKDFFLDLFFRVCTFAGRVHTPVTNFHREYRPNIMLAGSKTVSFDVSQMQPLILGKLLQRYLPGNEFSQWISEGRDIYTMIAKKANLKNRDAGKKRFFEILFAPASGDLEKMFGGADWIKWINRVKKKYNPDNPRYKIKNYSNMAWLLQRTEAEIMLKVWQYLNQANMIFLSVHDEIILREEEGHEGEAIIKRILDNEFTNYKLNKK